MCQVSSLGSQNCAEVNVGMYIAVIPKSVGPLSGLHVCVTLIWNCDQSAVSVILPRVKGKLNFSLIFHEFLGDFIQEFESLYVLIFEFDRLIEFF
jgi:hypothetical protein